LTGSWLFTGPIMNSHCTAATMIFNLTLKKHTPFITSKKLFELQQVYSKSVFLAVNHWLCRNGFNKIFKNNLWNN
jgi:hypothetical protein